MLWSSLKAWFDFKTLRGRYLGVTLLSVLFLLACASIAHFHSRREIDKGFRHLALLRETQSRFARVEESLYHADERLAVILFSPSEEDFEAWRRHMEEVRALAGRFLDSVGHDHGTLKTMAEVFMADLAILEEQGKALYRLRRDVKRAVPALHFLGDIMYQANLDFKGAAQAAMEDLKGDPAYPLLAEARILWGDIAFTFAVYALNRHIDPATPVEPLIHDITFMEEELQRRLKVLEAAKGLEVEGALETMKGAVERCRRGFKDVLKLRTLEDWRRDVAFYRRAMVPVIGRIHRRIQAIHVHLAEMVSRDVEGLSQAASLADAFLWSIAFLAGGMALIGFFSLERTVLHPIEQLAKALRGFPEREATLPHSNIEEIRSLTDAYALMAWIVYKRHRELEEEAQKDPLTGLLNRRAFLYHLAQLIRQSREAEIPFALFMIDLDGFKAINDTYGHTTGDILLKQVGRRLASSLRDVDILARYGGDEFVVLLPFSHARQAEAVCQRIVEALKQPFQVGGRRLVIGASVGIALFPRCGKDEKTLLERADAAMYQAKRAGGGCKLAS